MSETDSTESASFVARILAFAIDTVLLEALHLCLLVILAGRFMQADFVGLEGLFAALTFNLAVFFLAGCLFLPMTYFTVFHAYFGQTIGKMVMGIRVVDDHNQPAGLEVAFLRWCGYALSLAPLAMGFLWAAVDKDHCAWHDRLARTRVISAENS